MREKTYIKNIILLCLLGMFYSAPRANIPRSRQQQQKMWVKCSNKAQFVERGEGRDRDSEKSAKARYQGLSRLTEGILQFFFIPGSLRVPGSGTGTAVLIH